MGINAKVRRKFISICLLVLYVTYQASIASFTHVHYINGVMLVHSHPFQGEHTHSSTELVLIDRLSNFHALDVESVEILHPLRTLLCVFQAECCTSLNKVGPKQSLSLRGPPSIAA